MDHFGWTAAEVALAPSISSIVYILSVIPVSFIYKRSVRLVVLLGALLMASSLALSSQVTELWELYLFFGIMGGSALALCGFPLPLL